MNQSPKDLLSHPKQAYYETKKHTDPVFPYMVYPCTIPLDFPAVLLHWQDTMEIIYVKKGRGMAQVDLSAFEVQAGHIIFVPPGRLHGLKQIPGEYMEYENIIFDMTFLGSDIMDRCSRKYLQPLKENRLNFPLYITTKNSRYQEIAACLDDADNLCCSRCAGFELGVKGNIMKLLSVLFQLEETKLILSGIPQDTGKLKSILDFIEKNYRQPIKIEDAAAHCGYSSSHFMRWFKQAAGTSFIQHLNDFRLEAASRELKHSDKTVLEIAENSGFDNLSNFNRLFKNHFGITPRQMRAGI